MAKEHKLIKKWTEAWTFLGEVFEGFELARLPDGLMFHAGLCNELDHACSRSGWTSGGHLSTIIKQNIEQGLIEKMLDFMRNTTDLQGELLEYTNYGEIDDSVMLGLEGNDYNARALWCYLTAEVGPLKDYDFTDEERKELQKVHGVHYNAEDLTDNDDWP